MRGLVGQEEDIDNYSRWQTQHSQQTLLSLLMTTINQSHLCPLCRPGASVGHFPRFLAEMAFWPSNLVA